MCRIVERARLPQVLCHGRNAFTNDGRTAMLLRAVDGIVGLHLASTTREARCSVCSNALLSHQPREVLAPSAQHLLINVQTAPLFALSLHDKVNVRVLLIGV